MAALVVAAAAAVAIHAHVQPFPFHYENVLGTSMDVTVVAHTRDQAAAAAAIVLARIDGDANILSGYDARSEFSRWFRTVGEPVRVSPELYEVLTLFDAWRQRTGGALDASAQAVSAIWTQAARAGQLPSDAAIAQAVSDVRRPHWRLDPAARSATHLDSTPLILNSFTKSYIIDRAVRAGLDSKGVRGVVVNIGGDLVTRGAWTERVGITDPFDNADNAAPLTRLNIRDRAVATSGSYRRGFDIAGRHFSHIVDPRTGRPAAGVASATVVADRAADAGALATAFCVLSPDDSQRVAAWVPGAEFLIILADGRRVQSSGWDRLTDRVSPLNVPSPVASVYASEQAHAAYELTVALDIAQIQGGRVERPYVAVWIEDKDKFPVRTLAVLYRQREARYLSELRAWYKADRLRAMAEGTDILGSISSATRAPGHYTFEWDLKDQQGKAVAPGTYTVFIEAAREHGTHQLMQQAIDLTGAAKKIDVPGNGGVEISGASLDYHPAAAK
jgi:thiamine biosynthesis lipoprotein ApbE